MAHKKVPEKPSAAKPSGKPTAATKIPRLSVTVSDQTPERGPDLSDPLSVYGLFGREFSKEDQEHFIVLHLDGKNRLLARQDVSSGSQNASIVHPREVFKGALLNGSSAIVCVHNHPSGDPTPSQEDRDLTLRLKESADLLGIRLLDNIVIGDKNYRSLFKEGLLEDNQEGEVETELGKVFGENTSKKALSRKEAKQIIDGVAARLSLLSRFMPTGTTALWLENAENFGTLDETKDFLTREVDEEIEGASFVIHECFCILEQFHCLVNPEDSPAARSNMDRCTWAPPKWDKPDLSGSLVGPISALNLLISSIFEKAEAHKMINQEVHLGIIETIKDIRSDLHDISGEIGDAIKNENKTTCPEMEENYV